MQVEAFIHNVNILRSKARETREEWDRIIYTGNQEEGVIQHFLELIAYMRELGKEDLLSIDIDGVGFGYDELEELARDGQFETWRLLLSKDGLFSNGQDGIKLLLFVDKESFFDWTCRLNPFDSESPMRQGSAVKIFVDGLDGGFGGPSVAIVPPSAEGLPTEWPYDNVFPHEEDIKTQVHVGSAESICFSVGPFLLEWGNLKSRLSEPFRLKCAQLLVSSLVSDFFGVDRVVLRGVRRLELPISSSADSVPDSELIAELISAVKWVYEERTETRAKLLAERLSLDLEQGESIISRLPEVLKGALSQSREQYGFVILERKDAYVKELRDLLKDVRSQADLYAAKARGLLSSLMRDSLGGLLLISVSFIARVGSKEEFLISAQANFIFKALSVYFIASMLLQAFIHISDIVLSNKEIDYWSNATRNYMPIAEQKKHLKGAIKSRKRNFYFAAGILSLIYIGLALACFNFRYLLTLFEVISTSAPV